MKCPKCHYLGFETGDRCRNCGYDFSLLALADTSTADRQLADSAPTEPDSRERDLTLRLAPEQPAREDAAWLDLNIDAARSDPSRAVPPPTPVPPGIADDAARPGQPRREAALPLFSRAAPKDDEPLIKLPAAPRPPLSVRRTPDTPRLKAPASMFTRRETLDPEVPDEDLEAPRLRRGLPRAAVDADLRADTPGASAAPPRVRAVQQSGAADCGPGPRVTAAVIDAVLLLSIDLVVIYFTMKTTGLSMESWRLLPPIPIVGFLTLLKLAYFSAFTAFGGQTIGKMAARIRVVSEDDRYLDPATAVRRTLAAVASVATLGAAFVPALVGPGRRALHDRVAHTRVVALPTA